MTSFNQLIHGGAEGQPSLDAALAELIGMHSTPQASTPGSVPTSSAPSVAYVSLVDLVRSTVGTEQRGEICEECKTLNHRGACYCKTCMHKLPAYYVSANPRIPLVLWQRHQREERRTGAWDLAAVWVVLSSLVLMTAFIPVG